MAIDSKHEELQSLRIDRSAPPASDGEPSPWAKRYIVVGISVVVLLSLVAIAYRLLARDAPEVETTRAIVEGGEDEAGGTVLSASGYVVAHHKINVNSKVTGRVAWIGVEKGDRVKEGQVLVRLENDEYTAQVEQAKGSAANAKAYLEQLRNGSRPEEVAQAEHNLAEARATLVNDKLVLDRTRNLAKEGVLSQQALDDATAKYDASQQRVNSLEQLERLAKIGPRQEEIARAEGAYVQAQGQLAFAQSQLDATVIRAPVNGTILERTAEKGELVTAQFASAAEGGPRGSVVALADLNDIQVELDIAQDDFARLGAKQKASITLDAFPDRKYEGVIAEISPEANRSKATVQVKVQIMNPDSYLRPEMNSTVKFLAEEKKKESNARSSGALVPTNTLREVDGKKVVYLAVNGKALRREVQVTSTRASGVIVQGLIGGEDVITNAPPTLKDGDKIKIKGQS